MMMTDRNYLAPPTGMKIGCVPTAAPQYLENTLTREHPMFTHASTALALLLSLSGEKGMKGREAIRYQHER